VPKIVSEFKDFVTRGNVIDLAVAVVVGAAFTGVVNALAEGILTPLVAMFAGKDFSELHFTINGSAFFYGLVINAAIEFVLVAAAIFFFVVKPLNVLNERFRRGEDAPAPSPPTDEAILLAEIRDLLRSQANGSGRGAGAGAAVPPPGAFPPPAGPPPGTPPPPGRSF
jgi:large conductance mechanosensitive channel